MFLISNRNNLTPKTNSASVEILEEKNAKVNTLN